MDDLEYRIRPCWNALTNVAEKFTSMRSLERKSRYTIHNLCLQIGIGMAMAMVTMMVMVMVMVIEMMR